MESTRYAPRDYSREVRDAHRRSRLASRDWSRLPGRAGTPDYARLIEEADWDKLAALGRRRTSARANDLARIARQQQTVARLVSELPRARCGTAPRPPAR